jgi:fibronectin type 3 domain-containing protein
MRKLILLMIAAALLGIMAIPARAFTHPCVPTTLEELDTIKASLNREPWKSGYNQLANTSTAQLGWQMEGPFTHVSRAGAYDQNLTAWRNSMTAVYNLARMWYFTGNEAYAQKAHDILIAWATTHVSFTGNESGLALGDYAASFGGGASILRGTWPGWTAADTTAVQNYFSNVLWPASAGWPTQGPANKGALYLASGMSIALFCDNDTSKFDHVLNMFRTFHGTCLMDTLPTGQMGETGRDAGHCFGMLNSMTFIAECAWKQGVDLYSELDNRLLACGEYYARNNYTTDNPYVYFGTIDWQWISNKPGPYTANRSAFYLLQNAYKNRKNLPTPWIDRKLQEQPVDGYNFMYAKTADFTTATEAPASFPTVSPASSGLTLTTLGTQTASSSASYANGVWTMTGLGNGVWSDTTDDCQFAYTQMIGDCAMVAKVTSNQYPNAQARAGLMIRDNLTATIGQRAWIGAVSSPTMKMESHMRGWTVNWGGGGYDDRSHDWPPGLPYWIKIERRDKQITTFASPDGTSWSPLNCTYYGNLPSTLYLGMFVCSGTTTTNTATFQNVAFTGGTGGLVTTPAAPLGVLASGSNKTITVRWLASYGATAYDLLRSTTSGSGYTVLASDLTAAKTSYVDTTAVSGTTYYYVVQAKNAVGTSGNSPESGAALLSAPMVNLAFGGTTLASINTGSQVGGSDDAFNSDPGSKWYGYNSPTGWLQYNFGAGNAQVVKRYTINSADVPDRDPKSWNFLGSQDGVSWTTLDSQSNQSFALRMGMNTYNIGITTAYRYYRIDITANNGGTSGVAIGDFGLWGDSGHTLPDGRYRLVNRKSNKVVDVTGGATTNGTPLVQSDWSGSDSQQWDIAWQGNGKYRATGVASAKVIDNGGTSNADSNLIIQPSNGSASQRWTIASDSDGFYRIESANSSLVADVSGGSTAAGASIVQSTYDGSDSQLWLPSIGSAPQPIPPVPTGLAATPATISQINLTWTASPGAISYSIKRSTAIGGPYTTVTAGVNITSHSDIGLTASTTYYYVVSAVNGSGESTDSTQANATTLTAPPDAPTGLTTILGTNQVTLNWTVAGGATSYTVKRAASSGGPYTTVAEGVTDASYTDTGLTNGVTYHYVVVAVNIHGSSPDSASISATPSTLVVHFKFDEAGDSTAADSSGRAYHAALLGDPTFSPGVFGNTLNLPATGAQHARLPSGVTSGLTDFTVSTWVKINAFATWQRIFDFGTATNNYMFLTTQYTGTAPNAAKLRFAIRTPSAAEQIVSGNGVALTAGAWTHVAVTRSGTTVSLYVNGTLAGSGSIALNPADLGATTQNYLGKSQFNDPYLDAALDDFRLYSQAMSPAEISSLAHPAAGAPIQLAAVPGDAGATLSWLPNATTTYTVKRSTTSGGPYTTVADGLTSLTYTDSGLTNGVTYYYVVSGTGTQGPGPDSAEVAVVPSNLRLHLRFDESSGSVAADSSGSGRNATLVNAPTFAAGKLDNGLTLAAASAQYATLPSGVVSGLTDFTVSTWVKVNAFATWQRIFDFGTSQTNYMFLTTQYTPTAPNASKLRFGIRTPTVAEQTVSGTGVALSAGVWNHVAVIRSGTTVSIYVNGSLAGSGTIALSPADLGVTTQNYLGKSQFNDPYLDAAVDDFRLYSQALSASEIALYASPLAAPQNLAATPGPLSLDLNWNAVPNATRYTVKYSTTSGGPYATLASGLSATSQLHSGLGYGTTYYYVVSAGNSVYESPFSAELSATPDSAPLNESESATPDFVITPASGENPATATLTTATSVAGHSYQLQTSTGLASSSWQNVGEPVFGNGAPIVFETPYNPAQPRRFYRIQITR